jgi:hypothetical protein
MKQKAIRRNQLEVMNEKMATGEYRVGKKHKK